MDRRALLKFMPGAALAASMPMVAEASPMPETLEQRRDRLIAELQCVQRQMAETTIRMGSKGIEKSLTYAAFAVSRYAFDHPKEDREWRYHVDVNGEFVLMLPTVLKGEQS